MVAPVDVIPCTTAEHFLSLLSPASGMWTPEPSCWIFRGQADDWPLVPKAFRRNVSLSYSQSATDGGYSSRERQIFLELERLRAFLLIADREGLELPEDGHVTRTPQGWMNVIVPAVEASLRGERTWPPPQLLSLLGLAQHYGVPTRLLDWSESPDVAAYFAARGAVDRLKQRQPASELVVWSLNQRYLLERWNRNEIEVLIYTPPRATNPNLRAQAGLFTVHEPLGVGDTNALAVDEIIQRAAEDDLKCDHPRCLTLFPVLRKLTLSTQLAPRLLRLLYYKGIDAARIYPGLAGVVESLNEKLLYDQPWSHPWGDTHAAAYFGAKPDA